MCLRHSHTQLGTPVGAVPVAKTVGTGAPPGHRATTRCSQDRRPGIGFRAKHQVSGRSRRQSPHRVCCVLVGAARQPLPPSRRVHADLPSVRAPTLATTRPEVVDAVHASAAVSLAPAPALHAIHLLCASIRYVQDQFTCPSPSPSCDPPPLRVDSICPRSVHLPQPQPFIYRSPPFRIRFRSSLYLVFTFLVSNPKVAHVPADGTDQAGPAAAYGLGAHPPRGRGPKLDTA
jgi:hypothetical protein